MLLCQETLFYPSAPQPSAPTAFLSSLLHNSNVSPCQACIFLFVLMNTFLKHRINSYLSHLYSGQQQTQGQIIWRETHRSLMGAWAGCTEMSNALIQIMALSQEPLQSPHTQTRPWEHTELPHTEVVHLSFSQKAVFFFKGVKKKSGSSIIIVENVSWWSLYVKAISSWILVKHSWIKNKNGSCWIQRVIFLRAERSLLRVPNAERLCRCGLWFTDRYFISNYPSPPVHYYFLFPMETGHEY